MKVAKRGESGLSLLVGIDKPQGMSSHDVVNRVRRIFGERRVGHTGTLDPMATGVLPICIGPATRLDQYLTGHEKAYRATVRFGFETTTDDAEGEPTVRADVPDQYTDQGFARMCVESLKGTHEQVPPQYSAVKLDGKKAYEVARKGGEVSIPARTIEVYESIFRGASRDEELGLPVWEFDVRASKGTYIRSLARDLGRGLDCPAHLKALRRLQSGAISLEDCVSLETLEALGTQAALDPVRALNVRFAFCDDVERFVESGNKLFDNQVSLKEPLSYAPQNDQCACTSRVAPSANPPEDGELVAIVIANALKALYRYDAESATYRPDCVFSTPIARM
ncbi:MAG: tRNA pseudouridine(55) synthase TruB [Coriobacteriaceae bacterium]|nr:tRNA pseudouridine(55) synthase TruB [Coriobacteriaceae bacterium]